MTRAGIGRHTQVRGFYDREWTAAQGGARFERGLDVFRQIGVPAAALTGKRVLDGGSGTGVHAVVMAKHFGAAVTAVDIEPACVELTRRRAAQEGVPLECVHDSITALTLADGVFDTVVSIGVVHHTGDALACLRSFHRVLKPDGDCYVSVIRSSPLVLLQRAVHRAYNALPAVLKRPALETVLAVAWLVTRFSPAGRTRFTRLRVGVRDALHCPFHQVETDEGWCALLRDAGFQSVRFVRAWNVWGHQGLYHGTKPRLDR